MALYVFDTDILSLYRDGNPNLLKKVRSQSPSERTTTVITVQEYLTGWYALIPRAKSPEQLERAYARLASATTFLSGTRILNFTQAAIARYEQLKSLKLNIGKMDLRIAAIVLEEQGILVSRNLRDFRRVPNLLVEDWTAPVAPTEENGQSLPEELPP
jgi:tRNA(fMet)-specific endonuclease VapC